MGQLVFSQTCCSGGVPLSNNLGLPNEGKNSLIVGLNYDYNNLNTFNAGTQKLNDNSRLRITNSVLVNLGYAFTDRFSIESLFTWVNQTRTISQFDNESFSETSGIGDAVFLLKYAISDILGPQTVLNLGVGTKAPIGKSDLTTSEGFQLTADLQPGSGAWDVLGWMSLSKGLNFRPSATLSGSLTYRATGKNNSYLNNNSVYEFGNVLQANLGYTDQFLLFNVIFNPGLIFKYRQALKDKIDASDLGMQNIKLRNLIGYLQEYKNSSAEKQNNKLTCDAKKLSKQEAQINWHDSANQIDKNVRAFNPVPVAFFQLEEQRVRIFEGDLIDHNGTEPACMILNKDKHGILVKCGEGAFLTQPRWLLWFPFLLLGAKSYPTGGSVFVTFLCSFMCAICSVGDASSYDS